MDLGFILVVLVLALVALTTIGIILSRLYKRASKEICFVRTGFGGQKVVVDGGALVLPILHEVIPVNMNTLRLEVRRADEQALITRDRMRVDVQAEFYVRVQPTAESIAAAAQTLGIKTMHPMELKDLVEGKFVDALRAVAAEMAMEELHEQRVSFVQKVQTAVMEDLLKNGLELETVSLTGLDQTNRDFFNPNNAFDAEGLTRLTMEIEEKRKRRNDIEQDTDIAIKQKNLTAERQRLELSRDEEYAKLQQQREIQIRRAEQEAEIRREQADKTREAQEADIIAKRQVELAQIQAERSVTEDKIAKEEAIEAREITKRLALERAEQDRAIAIAAKSKEQSQAEAEADLARAEAVRASEAVVTTREVAAAERKKEIDLVEAKQDAEREAIGITVSAEAKKQAAEDEAEAVRTLAQGEAEKIRISAQAEADAERLTAEAAEVRYRIDAEGQRALNEAENVLASEIVDLRMRLALLEQLPHIVEQSVKPMERIDSIKIYQVDGMTGGNGAHAHGATTGHGEAGGPGSGGGSLADQVVSTALRYRAQAPLIDALMKEVGLNGASLDGLTAGANGSASEAPSSSDMITDQPRGPTG